MYNLQSLYYINFFFERLIHPSLAACSECWSTSFKMQVLYSVLTLLLHYIYSFHALSIISQNFAFPCLKTPYLTDNSSHTLIFFTCQNRHFCRQNWLQLFSPQWINNSQFCVCGNEGPYNYDSFDSSVVRDD